MSDGVIHPARGATTRVGSVTSSSTCRGADRPSPGETVVPRPSRRLGDRILATFHHACDEGRLDLAQKLLALAEGHFDLAADLQDRRRRKEANAVVAAHERLWELRHPERGECDEADGV